MISCLLALVVFVTIFFGGGFILRWIAREHSLANRYRSLSPTTPTAATPEAKGNQWKITYVAGRATRTATSTGDTEATALAAFVKSSGVKYSKIVSMERI